jgi:hypothetical protein
LKQPFAHIAAAACLILSCAAVRAAVPAPMPSESFDRANAQYRTGDFAGAERSYRALLAAGMNNGPVLYNLGNACFKQKKLGEAIYYWERALRQMPGDPEVRANLELANLLILDRIEQEPEPLLLRLVDRAAHLLTVNQESGLVLLALAAANALFSLYLFGRTSRVAFRAFAGSCVAGALALLFASALAWNVYDQVSRREAVVVEQRVDIRSGPGVENITVVTVHEGIKVQVRGGVNGWYQVSLPNGWNGWLPQNSIRII